MVHKMGRQTDLKELANEYFQEGIRDFDNHRLTEAILAMQTAKRLFFEVGDLELYVKSINWLGVIYAEIGIDDMAINFYIEGMEASVQYNLPHTAILFLNNIGTQYMELNKYDKSLTFFKKAEEELAKVTKEKEARINIWYMVSYMNIMVSYNHLQQLEKAESYLQKALPYIDKEENEVFLFTFRMAQYDLYWRQGKKQEVMDKIDEIMEGACDSSKTINYVQDVQMACSLLKEMKYYEQWEIVLNNFQEYCKNSDRIHVNMVMAELWVDYYKEINDLEKYREACINYTEASFKRRELLDNERANYIDMKLELREKEIARQEEHKKSQKDSLTNLGNRFKLEDDSIKMQREAIQKKTTMMVGILDIDCFKEYNDTYGHIQGDDCLKSVARVLEEVVQNRGGVYRFGGDEFVIIANDLSLSQTEEIAKDVKQRVADLQIPNINALVYPEVTISQGYCVFIPEKEGNIEDIISKADVALYKVKKGGRNNYSIWEDNEK